MSEGLSSNFQNASGAASNAYSSVSDSLSNFKNNVSSSMSDYASPASLGEASSEFLQSNSIIARIAFILFVIILITFHNGTSYLSKFWIAVWSTVVIGECAHNVVFFAKLGIS